MAILVEINQESDEVINVGMDTYELDPIDLVEYWAPYVLSFSAPVYETAFIFGGYVNMTFGQIAFSPDAFDSYWPPDSILDIDVYYAEAGDSGMIHLFGGDVFLDEYDFDYVRYNLLSKEYDSDLLDEATDYNENTVALPKAFGPVVHVTPVRLEDDSAGRPVYDLGGIGTGSVSVALDSFERYAGGTKTLVICKSNHPFDDGDSVTINGVSEFNGEHEIIVESSMAANEFVISVSFPTSKITFPIHGNAFISGGFAVYDDGVPIQENVIDNGDGTFSLTVSPVGEITISGTGEDTSLSDILDWGRDRLGIGNFDNSNARAVSPDVSYWADSQMKTIEFLSRLSAFFTHYFYVKSAEDELVLGDMFLANGNSTYTPFEYVNAKYKGSTPLQSIKCEWETREAVEMFLDDGVTTAKYVKATSHEKIVDGNHEQGAELSLEPFHSDATKIEAAMNNIALIYDRPMASVTIPITSDLPLPRQKVNFTDDVMLKEMSSYIYASRLQFNFELGEIEIEGDGAIS